MYNGWNVQEAKNVGILASLKISHFPFWFPTLKGSIREREGNGKNPFPKFGNGKGMKKSIPKIREREGNEKNPFPKFGKGIRGLHSWEWPGTGIPAHPCFQSARSENTRGWTGPSGGENDPRTRAGAICNLGHFLALAGCRWEWERGKDGVLMTSELNDTKSSDHS